MQRRKFITLLGGAAVAMPLAARAQQSDHIRRIGILTGGLAEDDPEARPRVGAFVQALQQLGWTDGRNIRIEYRFGSGDIDKMHKYARELVAFAPDVILSGGTAALPIMLRATRDLPIVFVNVADPVGAGFVHSLARPGGNATGFVQFEYTLSGKWLELLKEIAPDVKQAVVFRDPTLPAGIGQFAVIQSVAPSVGIDVSPSDVHEADEIERSITELAHLPNGGLILTTSGLSNMHRPLIIKLAAQYKIPAVYGNRFAVTLGGLTSYAPDIADQHRRAATYVDRILNGEKPRDLPVQAPTKYELVINLKTAKALGLTVSPALLARADEVIE
jgi:putative ABC transport system substrate-binding protein